MKILITGGTGFVGQRLCRNLRNHGHRLTVLSRRPNKVPELCGSRVKAVRKLSDLGPEDHFEVIINLAGEPIAGARWTPERKKRLRDSRIIVTKRLLKFIDSAQNKPRVLISGSAVGYYGNQGAKILDEHSGFSDDFGHQLCDEWERTAMKAAVQGIRVCIVRIGLVIGRDGGFLNRMMLPFKFGFGGPIASGQQWMSWVHINDLIAMIEYLMNTPHSHGVYNGTSPNPVTNEEFSRCLAKVMKSRSKFPIPGVLLKSVLGEMSTLLLGGQRAIPKRFQAERFKFAFENLERALNSVLVLDHESDLPAMVE